MAGQGCTTPDEGNERAPQGCERTTKRSIQKERFMNPTTGAHGSSIAKHSISPVETLRDFTTTWRVLPISGLAVAIGVVAAYVAVGLMRLIGFFTNLFFFQRLSTEMVSPGGHHLGYAVVAVPVIGG